MKKSLFTLAALATIMASCSSDDLLVDEQVQNEETQTAIGFGTYANKATRAAENSSETEHLGLLAHHDNFAVWGYKDVSSTKVFDDQLVSGTAGTPAVLYASASEYNDAKSTSLSDDEFAALTDAEKTKTAATADSWTYTPMRFWDKNSNSYEFYAAAPKTTGAPKWVLNANGTDQDDDYFTLSGVTLVNSSLASTSYVESMSGDGNTDYMIASPKNVPFGQYSNAVELDFNHILSRLNVTVKKGTTLAAAGTAGKLDITSLEVCNMANTGSFDESKDNGSTLSAGTVARWATPTGSLTYTGKALANVPSDKYAYILQSLVIPQTVANATVTRDGKTGTGTSAAPYIKIVYTIGTTNPETYTAYYNLAAVFAKTTSLNFCEGWQNTLNITIDADAIVFNPQVYNWEDAGNNFDIK